MKQSKVKEPVKSGPFEKFCVKKGFEREKGWWKRKAEKENEMKDIDLKEINLNGKMQDHEERKSNSTETAK